MATLKFFIRTDIKTGDNNVNVRVRLSIDRSHVIYATLPISVKSNSWDEKKQEIKLSDRPRFDSSKTTKENNTIAEDLYKQDSLIHTTNKRLADLRLYINHTINLRQDDYTSKWLQDIIDGFFAIAKPEIKVTLNVFVDTYIKEFETGRRLKSKASKRVSPGTIKSIKGFQSQFTAYQDQKNVIIDFEDITMNFYDDFKSWLLIDKNYSPNTVGRMIKILKSVMYAAKAKKLHSNNEFMNKDFAAMKVDVDNVYLTEERIDTLYNIDLSENKTWCKCRDVFIVGCLTGQRVSDFKRISKSMYTTLQNDKEYIRLKQDKTDKEVFIPVDWRVTEILDKYNGKLPKVYDQDINANIKLICEKAKFTEIIEIKVNKGGMEGMAKKRFCDMVKTHTGRRSLCTNMYKRNEPLSSIMAISGHESEEQLKTYLKLDNKEKAMLADNGYFQRVKMVISDAG